MIISIHALREEGDSWLVSGDVFAVVFLSTPSARRATLQAPDHRAGRHAISIHALREEGDVLRDTFDYDISISIHALREEGDLQLHQVSERR